MKADVQLYVDGKVYGGWESVSIKRSMSSLSGSFTIAFTDRWHGQKTRWVIPAGASCRVAVAGKTVITGYVDSVQSSHSATSRSLSVSGRDVTGDLVDCSAEVSTFIKLPFIDVAKKLCAPYGVSVVDEVGTDFVIDRFVVQIGESVFQTLERAAKLSGVLLTTDGTGVLIITRAGIGGRTDDDLVTGQNILTASLSNDASQLFSEITIKSQTTAGGQSKYDLVASQPASTVTRTVASSGVDGVDRHRPLILISESQATAERCRQRAQWEAGHRQALARKLSVTVQDWSQSTGALWSPNRLVHVKDAWLRIDEDWLIESVTYQLSSSGSTTKIDLVGPGSFDVLPEIPEVQPAESNKYKL